MTSWEESTPNQRSSKFKNKETNISQVGLEERNDVADGVLDKAVRQLFVALSGRVQLGQGFQDTA